ncbi:hypothetical protein [Herbaspirillum lusitanum]|uniref:hypothetical protein n=1 Tax=Herbaspirillum lusitanum TaxID=213312 RepID=UPI000365D326|nr:hypothetical protein [Herbaspirillum lusitanum]
MTNLEWDKVRGEITGLKAVLYSLCAVQTTEQSQQFQEVLQLHLNTMEATLAPSADATVFMEKTIEVINDFISLKKTRLEGE